MSRILVKEQVVDSWLEAVQAVNAAIFIGLGIELSSEAHPEGTEYRYKFYSDHFGKEARDSTESENPQTTLEPGELNSSIGTYL